MSEISYDDFWNVELRVGTILEAQEFPQARKPSYRLRIDFGPEVGIRQSSAQITHHYALSELPGKQVIAVCNFPKKQIANFFSEVLVLGVEQSGGQVVLLQPERAVENGTRIS